MICVTRVTHLSHKKPWRSCGGRFTRRSLAARARPQAVSGASGQGGPEAEAGGKDEQGADSDSRNAVPSPVVDAAATQQAVPSGQGPAQQFFSITSLAAARADGSDLEALLTSESSSDGGRPVDSSSNSVVTASSPTTPTSTGSGRSSGANGGGQPPAASAAMLQKMQKAREYRAAQRAEQGMAGTASPPPAAAAPPPLQSSQLAPPAADLAATQPPPPAATQPPQPQPQVLTTDLPTPLQQEASQQLGGPGRGDGTDQAQPAARWLQSLPAAEQQLDPNLSPEMFSLMKEERMKQLGGEVIVGSFKPRDRRDRMPTLDQSKQQGVRQEEGEGEAGDGVTPAASAAVGGGGATQAAEEEEEEGPEYKPKVATWGVFPRPQNISQAYGGGRNLRPGQALESDEQAQAREARVNAALKKYRKTLGTEVDPREEVRAEALCREGDVLFKQGALALALEKYSAAAALVPPRSRVGGEAYLQWALCLDSLGRSQEAYEIYRKIKGHPTAAVAKQVSRMLFGFRAAENLKAASISYTPPTKAWTNYFDRISRSSWNASIYTASQDDSLGEGGEAWATALALGVMLTPLLLVAYRIALVKGG